MKLYLTEKERIVVEWRIQGLTVKEIAAVEDCSPLTVKQHLHVVYEKFEIKNLAHLTRWYLEEQLNWKYELPGYHRERKKPDRHPERDFQG